MASVCQQCEDVDEMTSSFLTFPRYRDYYEEIRIDDADSVEVRIALTDCEEETEKLLHGRFQFTADRSDLQTVKRCMFTRPFLLAAAFASLKTCDVMMETDISVLFDVEDDTTTTAGLAPLNFVHCLVVVAVYEPQLESLMVDTFKHLSRHLSVDRARQLLFLENSEGLRPLEFASQQGTLALMTAIFDTRDIYLVRDDVIDTMVYHWYDITEYETYWTEPIAANTREHVDDVEMVLTERRREARQETSGSRIKLDVNLNTDQEIDQDVDPQSDSISSMAGKGSIAERDNNIHAKQILENSRRRTKRSQANNSVDPAVSQVNSDCNCVMKVNGEKEERLQTVPSRKDISPTFFLLCLANRHTAAANHLLRGGQSPLCHWMEMKISCHKSTYITTFILRLIYTLVVFIFEMDERWIMNVRGRSSTLQTGNSSLPNEDLSSTASRISSSFSYCAEFSSIRLSAFWITVAGVYLVLHSMIYVCTPFFAFAAFFCCSKTATLNQNIRWDLKGPRNVIVGGARSSDRGFSFICALCVIIEIALLPGIHTRVIGHMTIFIREMSSDLLAFLCLFMFFVAVFARQFMLFFNVNSQQGCVQDFCSFPITLYNLYLVMLNTLDFTHYPVYNHEILYLNHFAFVLIVGILLLNLLVAVFTNTMAHVKRNKEIIICLTRLCAIMDKDLMLAHVPLVSRFYRKVSNWQVKRGFVCEKDKVFLVCSSPLGQ